MVGVTPSPRPRRDESLRERFRSRPERLPVGGGRRHRATVQRGRSRPRWSTPGVGELERLHPLALTLAGSIGWLVDAFLWLFERSLVAAGDGPGRVHAPPRTMTVQLQIQILVVGEVDGSVVPIRLGGGAEVQIHGNQGSLGGSDFEQYGVRETEAREGG